MKKSNMRSMSETRQVTIIDSSWLKFEEHGLKFRVNVLVREYEVNYSVRRKLEYVILVDSTERPRKIIMTDFGPTCGWCLTSDYIKEDKSGEWFNKVSQGCTCTRCDASTLQ